MKTFSAILLSGSMFLFSPFQLLAGEIASEKDFFENLSVVWSANYGNGEQIYFSRYKDNNWSSSQQISRSDDFVLHPVSSVANDNSIWVIWTEANNNSNSLVYSMFNGEVWSSPEKIYSGTQDNRSATIAFDDNNRPVIAWEGSTGTTSDIYYSYWNDGGWVKPLKVHEDNEVPDVQPLLNVVLSKKVFLSYKTYSGGKYILKLKEWNSSKQTLVESDQRIYSQNSSKSLKEKLPELPGQIPQPSNATLFFKTDTEAGSILLAR